MKTTETALLLLFAFVSILNTQFVFSQGYTPNSKSVFEAKPTIENLQNKSKKKQVENSFQSSNSQNWKPFQLWEHGSSVLEPYYHNDSLVLTSGQYSASLINLKTKKLVHNFTDFTFAINGIDVSKDKKRILTSSDIIINIYDIESGEIRNYLFNFDVDTFFTNAKFSPDGHNMVVSTANGEIVVYNSFTRQIVNRKQLHSGRCNWVAYSPDGSKIASAGSDNSVIIYDANSLEFITSFSNFTAPVTAVCFNHKGNLIAAGGTEGIVNIYNVEDFSIFPPITIQNSEVNSINFSENDSIVVIAGFGGPFTLAKVYVKELQRIRVGRYSNIGARLNSSSNRILIASNDGVLREFDVNLDTESDINIPVTSYSIGPIRFSQNDTFLFTSSDWLTRTMNVPTGNYITSFVTQNAPIYAFDVSGTGEIHFTGGADGSLILRRAFEEPIELNAHQRSVWAVDITPDGRKAISADAGGTVVVWDMQNATEKYRFTTSVDGVYDVKISPDEQLFAVASTDRTTKVYDFETGNVVFEYTSFGIPWKIQWNKESTELIMVDVVANFYRLDIQNQQGIQFFDNEYTVYNFSVDPSGTKMVFMDVNEIFLFDFASNSVVAQVQFTDRNNNTLRFRESQFNSNNTKIAFYSDFNNLHLVSIDKWITSVETTPMYQSLAFPNPATYRVDITFNSSITNPDIKLFNSSGAEVPSTIVSQSDSKISLDVSQLEIGTYFIQFSNGTTNLRSKFVVNR